jgi:hypothetical protein
MKVAERFRRHARQGCRQAAQPREERDGGVRRHGCPRNPRVPVNSMGARRLQSAERMMSACTSVRPRARSASRLATTSTPVSCGITLSDGGIARARRATPAVRIAPATSKPPRPLPCRGGTTQIEAAAAAAAPSGDDGDTPSAHASLRSAFVGAMRAGTHALPASRPSDEGRKLHTRLLKYA